MIALAVSLMCLVLSQDEDDCGSCTENQTCVGEYYRQCYENCIESPARITGSGCACVGDTSEACRSRSVCNEGKCLQAADYCFDSFGYNDSCHIKKTEAACESPCWWFSSCGQCIVPHCEMYNTEETCTVSSGKDCVWKEDRLCGNSIVGCCREVYCSDYGTEETCTGTVNGKTCVWNATTNRCGAANCRGYDTVDTCKGTVNGEACVWLQDFYNTNSFYCTAASCYNTYLTKDTCKGTVGYDSCVWNPNFNNSGMARCESYSCNSYKHDSPTTCVSAGVVGGYSCVWDSVRGFCTNEKSDSEINSEICHGADGDETSCKGKSGEYGCVWSDGKCNGKSEKDNSEICHGADGDEESCKGKSEEYGCVWSNGKCNGESSFALRIVSSTLLIAFLLAFLF